MLKPKPLFKCALAAILTTVVSYSSRAVTVDWLEDSESVGHVLWTIEQADLTSNGVSMGSTSPSGFWSSYFDILPAGPTGIFGLLPGWDAGVANYMWDEVENRFVNRPVDYRLWWGTSGSTLFEEGYDGGVRVDYWYLPEATFAWDLNNDGTGTVSMMWDKTHGVSDAGSTALLLGMAASGLLIAKTRQGQHARAGSAQWRSEASSGA